MRVACFLFTPYNTFRLGSLEVMIFPAELPERKTMGCVESFVWLMDVGKEVVVER
jgi:hypothetical protein